MPPSLLLLPMTEADLPAYVDACWSAFGPGLMSVFYPDGFSAADRAHMVASETANWRDKGPAAVRMMKVVDAAARGRLVGCSKWHIHPRPRDDDDLAADDADATRRKEHDHAPGAHTAALNAFYAALRAAKRDLLGGRPHIVLNVLVTLPEYQGMGVARMSLDWGRRWSEQTALPIYLESSPVATPVYERCGYRPLGKIDFDARLFGSDREMVHTAMMRPVENA